MKLSRLQTIIFGYIFAFSMLFVMAFLWTTHFDGDTSKDFGALHIVLNVSLAIIFCAATIITSVEWEGSDKTFLRSFYDKENEKEIKIPSFRRVIWWVLLIFIGIILFQLIKSTIRESKFLYNTSITYMNTYNQKSQEKAGFYDKMWKTYYSKDKITNINKETFIQVTKIIMENRADGQQVTWKWVQENQQIPYEEFTKFYADLSNFIEAQREGYFAIEKACQSLANQHNTLLDTFPNNLYNKMLNRPRINFEYGFTSEQTEEVFRSKKENPN